MTGMGPERAAKNTNRLETDRLVIEVPSEADALSLFELVGGEDRDEVTAGLIWDGPDEIQETIEYIREVRSKPVRDGGFHWAIHDKTGELTRSPGTAIGMISARPSEQPGRGDVGYWLGKPYWGQGVMSEALTAVLDFSFYDLDHVKMEAEIFTTNDRSMRLVEGLGMQREGTLRSSRFKRGQWVDCHIYGILREEWRARRS
jgi:ribosomal-protein-alanine N-acetyltransferase